METTPSLQVVTEDVPQIPLIKCIHLGKGWAVHSIVFEFVNGERRGFCLENNCTATSLYDDDAINRRAPHTEVVNYGEYIVQIHGNYLQDATNYLCHTVIFTMSSGRQISFALHHLQWMGDPFTIDIPKTMMVTNVNIRARNLSGSIHVVQNSLCLPLSPNHAQLLPLAVKRYLLRHVLLLHQINDNVNMDVCWSILSFLCGYHYVPRNTNRKENLIKRIRSFKPRERLERIRMISRKKAQQS